MNDTYIALLIFSDENGSEKTTFEVFESWLEMDSAMKDAMGNPNFIRAVSFETNGLTEYKARKANKTA